MVWGPFKKLTFYSDRLFYVTALVGSNSCGSHCKLLSTFDQVNLLCFIVRGSRPGKTVQMTESEVRGLCLKSREIFLQQPILLELEAPLKICGELL